MNEGPLPVSRRTKQAVKDLLHQHWDRIATATGNLAYLSPKECAQEETSAG